MTTAPIPEDETPEDEMTINLDYDFTSDLASDYNEPAPVVTPGTEHVDFSPQQQEAMRKIVDWYTSGSSQVFRLFGYAGTGKTTLARHIVDSLGVRAIFAAFTGKAAYVLRSKGCDGARTIHSLIYQPVEKVRARLDELHALLDVEADGTEREVLLRAIKVEEEKLQNPDWILREDSDLVGAPLLVLDEVSMVGERIAADLLSFGVKVLCLGDPAQLPPVEGGGYFINHTPDHLLTEIHRSALDSPVTRLATSVRQSPPGDRTLGMGGMDGDSGRKLAVTRDEVARFDQVLVGTNKVRWQAIHLLRGLQGLRGPVPQPGDRVIGLTNSAECDIFNGQQFTVAGLAHPVRPDDDRVALNLVDDAGNQRTITAWLAGFESQEGEKLAKREGRGTVAAMTFAQAITCHKSQGSQWDRVLVVDESWIFARAAAQDAVKAGCHPDAAAAAGHLNGQRWLYTAITRAAQQVVVIASPRGLPA